MSGRDAILSRIRQSLGVTGTEPARRAAVTDRLQRAPKGIVPGRGQLDPKARLDLFCAMAEKVMAGVSRVASEEEVPAAVADILRRHNLPAGFRRGDDPRLARLPWHRTPQLTIATGRSDGGDPVGLSHAEAGVAETGTLVLASGPDNPSTLNFLPETHIVVVDAKDVVGDYESAFAALTARYGKGFLPRTVNLVTGPSRSGDIEQKILLGAHGPRQLHIVVVGEP